MASSSDDASSASGAPSIGPILRMAGLDLKNTFMSASLRTAPEALFTTLEDFGRADPALKRLLVIGCTGAGKSTLLNLMGGWRFVQRPPEYEFAWLTKKGHEDEGEMSEAATSDEADDEGKPPLFESDTGTESVTKRTAFANLFWFGDPKRKFIAVDTPGHDDPSGADIASAEARDVLGELAADLHNKLRALGSVNAILVLHNDVVSNRLNPATYTVLKMIEEKFAKTGGSVWKHVIVGYSKCNSHDLSWRSGIKAKCASMQAALREKIDGCNVDVPVVPLGGASIDPPPPSSTAPAENDGFQALWNFVNESPPLDCSNLQPFEGADVKWQKMINDKDEAEARAKAALIYAAVLFKLGMLLLFLFTRAFMLPRFVAGLIATCMLAFFVHAATSAAASEKVPRGPLFGTALAMLMVNLYTVFDEVLIIALFVTYVGPQDLKNSLRHFHNTWVEPRFQVNQHLEAFQAAAVPYYDKLVDTAKGYVAPAAAAEAPTAAAAPSASAPSKKTD